MECRAGVVGRDTAEAQPRVISHAVSLELPRVAARAKVGHGSDGDDDDDGPLARQEQVRTYRLLKAGPNHPAQREKHTGPDRARDRRADRENWIGKLENAGDHGQRHAKARNVAAEDQRPWAIAAEPVLRAGHSVLGDVEKSGQAVFDQTPAEAAR